MGASAAWRVGLVVHPLTVASVVLLAANDAWFTAWWPGLLTGTLSDVAGVWMVGALAVAVTGSVRWGSALTALGFALLKTVSSVAVLAAPVLGGVTRSDPADLVALLVLWPLGRLAQRLGAQRTHRANDAWSTVAAVFVLSGAAFPTPAAGCDVQPEVTEVALSSDGVALAHYLGHGATANDGWYELTETGPVLRPGVQVGSEISTRACVSTGCYYRVVPGVGVFVNTTLVYGYSEEQLASLRERPSCGQAESFGSIVAVEHRHRVDLWVSMGTGGVLHRDPEGEWSLLAVADATPPGDTATSTGDGRSAALWLIPLVPAAALAVVLPMSCRSWRRGRLLLVTAAAVVVNVGWAVVGYRWMADQDLGVYPRSVGLFIVVWVAPWVMLQLVWVVPAVSNRRRKSPPDDTTSWPLPSARPPSGRPPSGPPPSSRPPSGPPPSSRPRSSPLPFD